MTKVTPLSLTPFSYQPKEEIASFLKIKNGELGHVLGQAKHIKNGELGHVLGQAKHIRPSTLSQAHYFFT